MSEQTTRERSAARLRKVARLWSAVSIGLVALVFLLEVLYPHGGDEEVPLIDWVLHSMSASNCRSGCAAGATWQSA